MSKLDTPEADFLRINNTLKLKNKKGGSGIMKKCTCKCNCEGGVDYTTFRAHYHAALIAKLNKAPILPLVCKKCKASH